MLFHICSIFAAHGDKTQQQWWCIYAVKWWRSNLHLKINNTCWSHREAHLLWQREVKGRTRLQNSSLELAGSHCLAQWHLNRCLLTTWVVWVKASLSDHLSTLDKYVKVSLVYSLTFSPMQQFFFIAHKESLIHNENKEYFGLIGGFTRRGGTEHLCF